MAQAQRKSDQTVKLTVLTEASIKFKPMLGESKQQQLDRIHFHMTFAHDFIASLPTNLDSDVQVLGLLVEKVKGAKRPIDSALLSTIMRKMVTSDSKIDVPINCLPDGVQSQLLDVPNAEAVMICSEAEAALYRTMAGTPEPTPSEKAANDILFSPSPNLDASSVYKQIIDDGVQQRYAEATPAPSALCNKDELENPNLTDAPIDEFKASARVSVKLSFWLGIGVGVFGVLASTNGLTPIGIGMGVATFVMWWAHSLNITTLIKIGNEDNKQQEF